MTFTMTDQEFADYLDSARITGQVATPRENNLAHIQGFLEGNEHLEFGVKWTRDWTYQQVFDLMVKRVGIQANPAHAQGQDTISAQLCLQGLRRYGQIFGQAVRRGSSILFATGHPAGLLPIYARLAQVARSAGAQVLTIEEGMAFGDGEIRQIFDVIMLEQYGNLQHTHFPGPMQLALEQLEEKGIVPDLVVADHGLAGYSASLDLPTIGIADCNDPGLFVSAEQEQILVAVPMDDNVSPHLYEPVIDFILDAAQLAE